MNKNIIAASMLISLLSCTTPTNNVQPEKGVESDSDIAKSIDIHADSTAKQVVKLDQLISPGVGIGHLLIGDDQANAIKQLGKPDFGDAAMGSSLATWYSNHDSSSYQTSIFSGRNFGAKDEDVAHIKKILVTSPWFKTSEQLGVGATLAAIKKNYSLALTQKAGQHNNNLQTFTDKAKGISFEVDSAGICVGIIVHQPNDAAGTYLDMHQK